MSFFDFLSAGKKGTAVPAKSQIKPLGLSATPVIRTDANDGDTPPVSGGLQLISERREVITRTADFPRREEVLTAATGVSTGFIVPVNLQDALMMVRTSAREAVIVYDPAFTNEVKGRLATLRSTAIAQNLNVTLDPILATKEVIKEAREAAEANQARSKGGSLHGQSGGAALFREWVLRSVEAGATDLHIGFEAGGGGRGEVLMKIDGEFEPVDRASNGIFTDKDVRAAQIAAFSLAEGLSNSESVFSENESRACIIDSKLRIPNIRLRFGSQRGVFGPKAVCRILHTSLNRAPMSFLDMGYSMDQLGMLAKAQRIGSGLIVLMGETGSGKTTALKTLIETHPRNGKVAFYEIADPVEYYMKGVHQVPVQRNLMDVADANDPYAEVVSSLMRMDPSVISIGEIRDRITAQGGNYVATSGHVAMATMHSDGMIGGVARFSDPTLGLTRQTITGGKMLGFMGYQALAPKLCKCAIDFTNAVAYEKDHQNYAESDYLGTLTQSLRKKYDIDAGILKFKNPEGCHLCGGRGTKGLTMLAEMMLPDDTWLDLSAQGKDRDAMRHWRRTYSDHRIDSPSMNGKLVIEHAIHKSYLGTIDPRNVEKHGVLDLLEVTKP